MRVLSIIIASVVAALILTITAGCASRAPEPAKLPEPLAYDKADYTPPTDFDMKVDTSGSTFNAPAVKAPPTTAFAPRLVSMEKTAAQ